MRLDELLEAPPAFGRPADDEVGEAGAPETLCTVPDFGPGLGDRE
jgi:hypothetical protein